MTIVFMGYCWYAVEEAAMKSQKYSDGALVQSSIGSIDSKKLGLKDYRKESVQVDPVTSMQANLHNWVRTFARIQENSDILRTCGTGDYFLTIS
jgi:hypothetical protein